MSDASISIGKVLDNEGGQFVSEDEGRGASRWGVTLATARAVHPSWNASDIQNLTRDEAYQFYLKYIWPESRCTLLTAQSVADKVFDLYVNMGPGGWRTSDHGRYLKDGAITLLQRVSGAAVDGALGQETARCVNAIDPEELLANYRAAAEAHYRQIAASNPAQAGNLDGWLARLEKA